MHVYLGRNRVDYCKRVKPIQVFSAEDSCLKKLLKTR